MRQLHPLLLALVAASLFGASAPASKALLGDLTPFQLAGLLYCGAALGVAPFFVRGLRAEQRPKLSAVNKWRLASAVICGGILAPVLLLFALQLTSAGSVSLLLNLEMVATSVLAVAFFGEHLGRRGWVGIATIVGAGALLSLGGGRPGLQGGILAACACIFWGLDNNFTSLIDGLRPVEITFVKGLVAGATNLTLGCMLAPVHASAGVLLAGLGVGAISYGASLVLYVTAAQQLGATRSQAAFATAPFAGALLSLVFLHESLGPAQAIAGILLGVGVALSLTDKHAHFHEHEAQEHVHAHRHDDGHHDHDHPGVPRSTRHVHAHAHERIEHSHGHVSDLHHRHPH